MSVNPPADEASPQAKDQAQSNPKKRKNYYQSDPEILEQALIALKNAQIPEIAKSLSELNYDSAEMAKGQALYQSARNSYDAQQREKDERSAAYQKFNQTRTQLQKLYDQHRKKAKVAYRNDPDQARELGIDSAKPRTQIGLLEAYKKFYRNANASGTIKAQLIIYRIREDQLKQGKTLIEQLESEHAKYLQEKGQSHQATQSKDQAMDELENWMNDFYEIAKIALEDRPQFLESL
ncbi:MAG: hypothetical protein AAF975_04355, partial [Spirochaetota bacterium]